MVLSPNKPLTVLVIYREVDVNRTRIIHHFVMWAANFAKRMRIWRRNNREITVSLIEHLIVLVTHKNGDGRRTYFFHHLII